MINMLGIREIFSWRIKDSYEFRSKNIKFLTSIQISRQCSKRIWDLIVPLHSPGGSGSRICFGIHANVSFSPLRQAFLPKPTLQLHIRSSV